MSVMQAAKIASNVAMAGATVALFVTAFATFDLSKGGRTDPDIDPASVEAVRDQIEKAIKDLENRKKSVKDREPETPQIAELQTSIKNIDKRLSSLEDAIATSPEKALSLPMLRNEINHQKELNTQDISSINSSVDRLYNIAVGLFVSMVLSMFAVFLKKFFPDS